MQPNKVGTVTHIDQQYGLGQERDLTKIVQLAVGRGWDLNLGSLGLKPLSLHTMLSCFTGDKDEKHTPIFDDLLEIFFPP